MLYYTYYVCNILIFLSSNYPLIFVTFCPLKVIKCKISKRLSLKFRVLVVRYIKAIKRALLGISDDYLPLPKKDYLSLISLRLSFNPFELNDQLYVQHEGLSMASTLSPIAARLFMEMLEDEDFSKNWPGHQMVSVCGRRTSHHSRRYLLTFKRCSHH